MRFYYKIFEILIKDHDTQLVEELHQGDVRAFDKLFEVYATKLYGFVLKFLKSESDAEDVVQTVFVKVWERRSTLQKEASFKSYLFTIAYNDVLKIFRSRSYQQAYHRELITQSDVHDHLNDRVDFQSVLTRVDELVEQLPERRKTIFIKSRKEGLSAKEIALELNISSSVVDNNISEALKFLRKHLKNETLAVILYFSLFFQ
jgi:RNA polymerase sigma-70 factor (ECF subfamily)